MSLTVRRIGNIQILELSGDFTTGHRSMAQPLDLQGRPLEDLGRILRDLLDRGHRNIILELSRVTFIDSAGLGELVACRKRTLECGGDIKLLRPGRQVRKLLVMTLLSQLFDIYEDEAKAIGAFDAA